MKRSRKLAKFLQSDDYPLSVDMMEDYIDGYTEEMLVRFCDYCEGVDEDWATEFRAWIPDFLKQLEQGDEL